MLDRHHPETHDQCRAVHRAMAESSSFLSDPSRRTQLLLAFAEQLTHSKAVLLTANQRDLDACSSDSDPERLVLNDARLDAMIAGVTRFTTEGPGDHAHSWTYGGMHYTRHFQPESPDSPPTALDPHKAVTVIYERRPTVTSDAIANGWDAGVGILLRGSASVQHSNHAIVDCAKRALVSCNLSPDLVQILSTDHDAPVLQQLVTEDAHVSMCIVRGGDSLVQHLRQYDDIRTVPLVITGKGNVHIYVSRDVKDLDHAIRVVVESKCQRFVCNSAEALLLHRDQAKRFLTALLPHLVHHHRPISLLGDPDAKALVESLGGHCDLITHPDQYHDDYEGPTLRLTLVNNDHDALQHIQTYTSHHTEVILSDTPATQDLFINGLEHVTLLINASSRLHDSGAMNANIPEIGTITHYLTGKNPHFSVPTGSHPLRELGLTRLIRTIGQPLLGYSGLRGR